MVRRSSAQDCDTAPTGATLHLGRARPRLGCVGNMFWAHQGLPAPQGKQEDVWRKPPRRWGAGTTDLLPTLESEDVYPGWLEPGECWVKFRGSPGRPLFSICFWLQNDVQG